MAMFEPPAEDASVLDKVLDTWTKVETIKNGQPTAYPVASDQLPPVTNNDGTNLTAPVKPAGKDVNQWLVIGGSVAFVLAFLVLIMGSGRK